MHAMLRNPKRGNSAKNYLLRPAFLPVYFIIYALALSFLGKKRHLQWWTSRTLWKRGWRSWRRRSLAPFVTNTSAIPRSSLASITTARCASDNWPFKQGPTVALRALSVEGERVYHKMIPINCPRRFSSTE